MELEHLLVEWRIRHKVSTNTPWDHIRVYCLQIAFTRLVVDSVIYQRILGDVCTQACHDTGELLLVETRVHRKDIVIKRRVQSQVTHCLVHRIRVIAHRLHLLDGRLINITAIYNTRKLFLAELITETQVWRPIESII